jgi:hypothetical protein
VVLVAESRYVPRRQEQRDRHRRRERTNADENERLRDELTAVKIDLASAQNRLKRAVEKLAQTEALLAEADAQLTAQLEDVLTGEDTA